MTVPSATARNDYLGTGSAGPFPFTFGIQSASHLVVTKRLISTGAETTLAQGVDYTLAGSTWATGGAFTLSATLSSSYALAARRIVPLTQQVDLRNQAAFFAEVHEAEFDLLAQADQQQQDQLDRSIKLPATEAGSEVATTLPAAAVRASKFLAFDAVGNVVTTATGPLASGLLNVNITQAVTNVAALRTYPLPSAGYLIQTSGYATVGDGGHGVYVWSVADARADDGGSVLAVAGYPVGRWNLLAFDGVINVRQFGAKGDGVTSDAVALQAAFSVGGEVLIPAGMACFLPAATMLTITASNLTVRGPGKIIGPPVAVQGVPTAYIKGWGSLGSTASYGSVIAKGASTFAVANAFATGQLVQLSNFPTDASDSFTLGAADPFGRAPMNFTTTGAANLRQTRRKELLEVSSASGATLITTAGCFNAYPSTSSLKFDQVVSLDNLTFDGVILENIYFNFQWCRNLAFKRCTALSCLGQAITCYKSLFDFTEWDARNMNGFLDILESSKGITVRGWYGNLNCTSDNGIIKHDGCQDIDCDVIVEGCRVSNGVMLDTNFGNNPTGYTDLPAGNASFKIIARDMNGYSALSLTTDPFAAGVSYVQFDVIADGCGVLVKGCDHVDGRATLNYQDGSGFSVNVYGSIDINLSGQWKGSLFQTTVTDPRTGSVQSNARVSTDAGPKLMPTQPAFLARMTAATTNSTGDGTAFNPVFDFEVFDRSGSHLNGIFTAPVTGIYRFDIYLRATNIGAGHTSGWCALVTTARTFYANEPNWAAIKDAGNGATVGGSFLVSMTAGDTAKVEYKGIGSTKTMGLQGGTFETFWSGNLVA